MLSFISLLSFFTAAAGLDLKGKSRGLGLVRGDWVEDQDFIGLRGMHGMFRVG